MRVLADGQTDRQTDAIPFYNLSHAICYSYGTDKNDYSVQNASIVKTVSVRSRTGTTAKTAP